MSEPTLPSADWLQKFQTASALHLQGQRDSARTLYLELVLAQPHNAALVLLLGLLEKEADKLPFAARWLELAFSLDAKFQTAMHLAEVQLQLQDYTAARKTLEAALSLQPASLQALNMLVVALNHLGEYEVSLALQLQCLERLPENPTLHYNLGCLLHTLERFDEAVAAFTRALELKPTMQEAAFNRGNALREKLQLPQAIASFERAVALQPDNANFHWSLALAALLAGDYPKGWRHYERRWTRDAGEAPRQFAVPQWSGREDIRGKTLVIHGEQGLGDIIQFSRYALDAIARGARVVFGAPLTLHPLLRSMHPALVTAMDTSEHPEFDFHCPVMSLPYAFSTTVQTVPAPCPYYVADGTLQRAWAHRLGPRSKPRIGLVWFGNPAHLHDHRRSIALQAWWQLLQLPLEFHSLQQQHRPQDEEVLAPLPPGQQVHFHGPALSSLSETAALMANLDLVLTVDTSVAHLAGALGKPVWVLVHAVPDFRWLLERDDSPWYPSARIFRQKVRGSWTEPLDQVYAALVAHFALATD